ncbi:hypothetical protein SDC9_150927 [bioreactor metagenome]|uniref:Uncharacterized protein n=1 Tax=bioreactor metagenome TaxID=1076179 RepID=A0A645ENU8_9ZZZZ
MIVILVFLPGGRLVLSRGECRKGLLRIGLLEVFVGCDGL